MNRIQLIILVGAALASIVAAAAIQPHRSLMGADNQVWSYDRTPSQLLSQSNASVSR